MLAMTLPNPGNRIDLEVCVVMAPQMPATLADTHIPSVPPKSRVRAPVYWESSDNSNIFAATLLCCHHCPLRQDLVASYLSQLLPKYLTSHS